MVLFRGFKEIDELYYLFFCFLHAYYILEGDFHSLFESVALLLLEHTADSFASLGPGASTHLGDRLYEVVK